MRKIMVIGSCGAGKSYLSKRLHNILGLEVISLDAHYWKPGWTETPSEEWTNIVKKLADRPSWIIDGNYNSTMEFRLTKADIVIFLDFPTWKCMYRAAKRVYKYHGEVRPEMAAGCPERFSFEFFHYILMFRSLRRKAILNKLKSVRKTTEVFIFKTDHEVNLYLESLKN